MRHIARTVIVLVLLGLLGLLGHDLVTPRGIPSACATPGTCASTGVSLAVNPAVVEPGGDLQVIYQTPPNRPTTDQLVLVQSGTTTPLFPAVAINGARIGSTVWTMLTGWNGMSLKAQVRDASGTVLKETAPIAVQTCQTTTTTVKLQLQATNTGGPTGTPITTAATGSVFYYCFDATKLTQGTGWNTVYLIADGNTNPLDNLQSFRAQSTSGLTKGCLWETFKVPAGGYTGIFLLQTTPPQIVARSQRVVVQ